MAASYRQPPSPTLLYTGGRFPSRGPSHILAANLDQIGGLKFRRTGPIRLRPVTESKRHAPSVETLRQTIILIVEDTELSRNILTRRLRRRGYHVSAAHDGLDSLEKVNAEGPDLVLMDMGLPGLNGWERPRIALTAHEMPEDLARCLEADCDDFATRPKRFPSLLPIIERFIGTS